MSLPQHMPTGLKPNHELRSNRTNQTGLVEETQEHGRERWQIYSGV
jgi:hypothetical protein